MSRKGFRIGIKLAIGFGSMLLLIVIGGLVGYSGLQNVGRSLTIVGDEEASIVDASMEMKFVITNTRIARPDPRSS